MRAEEFRGHFRSENKTKIMPRLCPYKSVTILNATNNEILELNKNRTVESKGENWASENAFRCTFGNPKVRRLF